MGAVSGHYRLTWPAQALAAAGHDVTLGAGNIGALWTDLGDLSICRAVDIQADVAVFQRPLDRDIAEAIPILQAQGTAVVVEIDDDFHALPAGHPARVETSAGHNPTRNRRWLRIACERADLVTCTTRPLVDRYAPHGRAIILPNCVPHSYLTIPRPRHTGVRVGWTGSTVTHVGDLAAAGTGIADGLRDVRGAAFWVVGTGNGVRTQLGLDDLHASGWVSLDRYPHAYAELDIAVAPLAANRFNEAKSWLKPLEAAALGIPCVASPTTPYLEAEAAGLCRTAATPDDWRRRIRALLIDPAAREIAGEDARAQAAQWTVEGNAWRWLEAWEQAFDNYQHRKAAA